MRLLGKEDDTERYDRLDSINALVSDLKKLLQKRKQKLVVVLAGVDQQRGATPTLLPALARLSDVVSRDQYDIRRDYADRRIRCPVLL